MASKWFKDFMVSVWPPNAFFERTWFCNGTMVTLLSISFLYQPSGKVVLDLSDFLLVHYLLTLVGGALFVASNLSLDEADIAGFGILKVNKKGNSITYPYRIAFKTPALYQLFRHPMYAGVLMLYTGLNTMWTVDRIIMNAVYFGYIFLGCLHEETLILAKDPSYAQYKQEVRWRFIPDLTRLHYLWGKSQVKTD
eukprot:CAMPEP_0114985702 /NCGR_PEP_ID=MMETSP0216-20121206/8014_2 /TAXON_ID=223996 /ORGANISM="Protocruzia adherens, Strain Boccale" /LENGTH=194 /DNA_ID=CAMNT_0002348049 /DNA_START=301 /DNA_END=885 /DNA_ORIENTATION=-